MKISVITPSFNQGQFIQRTINSVAMQKTSLPEGVELEHMICDGGSTDDTLHRLQQSKDMIRYVSEKDNGQTHAINKGIQATDGEIIGWLNSDDVYYPGTLKRVVDFFAAHPAVDVVYGMADHIDEHDKAFETYPSAPWNFELLKDRCFICQPALFFRRRVIVQHGLLDEQLHYCMDYEYWLRLGQAGVSFAYIEEKLAGSRLYADNKTLGARVKVHAEINSMFKKKWSKVPDKWLLNYAHVVVEAKLERAQYPTRFLWQMFVAYLKAAWYWNRQIIPPKNSPWVNWGKVLRQATIAGVVRKLRRQSLS